VIPRRLVLRSTLLLPASWPSLAAAAETLDGSWLHAPRQRTLPWRLRLPSGQASCPLVLYSHGLGGSRDSGHAWGTAWSQAGVVVLHVQHPGSDADALRRSSGALQAAASADQFIERLLDLRFAIDELVRRSAGGEAPWNRIRTDAIGVAGHSFGALTTQALAGQRYPAAGDLSDPRPKAFVALSPSVPIGVKLAPGEAFAGVVRPFFALTGSRDASPMQASPRTQRAAVYDALPRGQRALLWLAGATHRTFGGGQLGGLQREERAGQEDEAPQHRHGALIASATAAWWRWHLLGDGAARSQLESLQGLSEDDRLLLG
jgi:predicted dienelactone hydrolase